MNIKVIYGTNVDRWWSEDSLGPDIWPIRSTPGSRLKWRFSLRC